MLNGVSSLVRLQKMCLTIKMCLFKPKSKYRVAQKLPVSQEKLKILFKHYLPSYLSTTVIQVYAKIMSVTCLCIICLHTC